MPSTIEQADGDKPTSDSPPPFGRAITGRSAWHRSRTWHTYWPRRFGDPRSAGHENRVTLCNRRFAVIASSRQAADEDSCRLSCGQAGLRDPPVLRRRRPGRERLAVWEDHEDDLVTIPPSFRHPRVLA